MADWRIHLTIWRVSDGSAAIEIRQDAPPSLAYSPALYDRAVGCWSSVFDNPKCILCILAELDLVPLPVGEYESKAYLSAADLPPDVNCLSFDLIAMPPVSLFKNLRFQGAAWQIGNFIVLANLPKKGRGQRTLMQKGRIFSLDPKWSKAPKFI